MGYIMRMRRVVIFPLAFCLAGPLASQEQPSEDGGLSLMERGAQMFMEGMLKEMEPALEGLEELGPMLRGFAQEMGPALTDLLEQVEDWSVYHPPEILPNGDIILRRKTPEELENSEGDGEPIDI